MAAHDSFASSGPNWLRFNASAIGRPAIGSRPPDDRSQTGGPIDVSFGRPPDLVVLHQGVVDLVRGRVGADIATAFLNSLTAECWTVIESGRGIAPEVQESGEKFLSFSLIEHAFHGKQDVRVRSQSAWELTVRTGARGRDRAPGKARQLIHPPT